MIVRLLKNNQLPVIVTEIDIGEPFPMPDVIVYEGDKKNFHGAYKFKRKPFDQPPAIYEEISVLKVI